MHRMARRAQSYVREVMMTSGGDVKRDAPVLGELHPAQTLPYMTYTLKRWNRYDADF